MAGGVTASMQLEAQNGREKEVEKGGRDGRARMPASAPELAVATARQPAAVAAEGSCPRGGGAPPGTANLRSTVRRSSVRSIFRPLVFFLF